MTWWPAGGRGRRASTASTGVLAVLALAAGDVVSADRLTEAVWGGEPPPSDSLQSHALAVYRDLGDRPEEAQTLDRLGDVRHSAGDTEAARRAWLGALRICDEIDHQDAGQIRVKLQVPGAQLGASSA